MCDTNDIPESVVKVIMRMIRRAENRIDELRKAVELIEQQLSETVELGYEVRRVMIAEKRDKENRIADLTIEQLRLTAELVKAGVAMLV